MKIKRRKEKMEQRGEATGMWRPQTCIKESEVEKYGLHRRLFGCVIATGATGQI